MILNFQRGDAAAPKGHALLYFQGSGEASKFYATYIVVLPISIDMVKYMPPFLAPHLSEFTTQELSAFAFPPVPENVENPARMEAIAQARGDDVLYGGEVDSSQIPNLLATVNEVVQAYGQAYLSHIQSSMPDEAQPIEEGSEGVGVNEVLYQLMGERDRLAELSRLVGKLRFAVEGNDHRQVQEVQEEVQVLAKHLSERYNIGALVEAAKNPSRTGGELAHLCLERCYKLADEDYTRLKEIEDRIRTLEQSEGQETPEQR